MFGQNDALKREKFAYRSGHAFLAICKKSYGQSCGIRAVPRIISSLSISILRRGVVGVSIISSSMSVADTTMRLAGWRRVVRSKVFHAARACLAVLPCRRFFWLS